ncbi:endonuclease/exonuclease/phosphatase family protein [Kitasatospora sp. YST-16]|uniref:endonuclease/exonuclease/phosphatase family protein n=1 Tax=Kitasatospora sp. YST-16 TaxID=2998080 RepID=UPI002283E612|nr:endonuclease/exonuclease/phosphatase family protein [Kitasatospora sp. YST-16]WAL71175.1 endonuclease/exonuclease/phosphatase family protein [Kitasatospora sp. YST-16]WNW37212.1 endonuclease/exonuclease/phosphatase family protein [Streptomyces sp. Li-HN-5-13]
MPLYSTSVPRARRLRLVLGAAAGVLLLGLVPAVRHDAEAMVGEGGPDGPVGPRLTVATWNMCGEVVWGCGKYGSGEQKVEALRSMAVHHGVRAMLVQEACRGDLERARTGLGADWQLAFQPYAEVDDVGTAAPVDCGDGRGEAGIGILAAAPLTDVSPVAAPQPEHGLRRGILCATATAPVSPTAPDSPAAASGGGLRLCVAHLSLPPADRSDHAAELRDDQLAALLAAGTAWAPGTTSSVFGGDFNSSPPGQNGRDAWIWPAAYFDTVQECAQQEPDQRSGFAPTHQNGRKLDYLFTALPRHGCHQVDTGSSDHRAELLTVTAAL